MSDALIVLFIYLGCFVLGIIIVLAWQMYLDYRERRPREQEKYYIHWSPFDEPSTHGGF